MNIICIIAKLFIYVIIKKFSKGRIVCLIVWCMHVFVLCVVGIAPRHVCVFIRSKYENVVQM